MIRFIDLREQSTGYRFAFWCTTRDRFIQFAGEQAWDTKDEFIESYELDSDFTPPGWRLSRFVSLMPSWVTEPQSNQQFSRPFDFTDAMRLIDEGWNNWAAKEHNRKWSRRVEGTPIRNDLTCSIAHAIIDAQQSGRNSDSNKKSNIDDA